MDARDEVPVVIYHSHTATEAYPSRTDIALAQRAATRTTCSSPPAPRTPREFRSFRIVDGVVTEEDVSVVESYAVVRVTCSRTPARTTFPTTR